MRLLVVEDDEKLAKILSTSLSVIGDVDIALSGEKALQEVEKTYYDLVIRDLMLGKLSGMDVLREIRRTYLMPIIVLSALSDIDKKIDCFRLGADDYMTKPFSFKEMVGRVNAQLRRYYEFNTQEKSERVYGDMKISSTRHEVKVGGESVPLTLKEFNLLDFLTKNANQIFSKQKLIDVVWGYDDYIDENTVAVTVARLREKLARYGIENVVTVWGLGYKWQD